MQTTVAMVLRSEVLEATSYAQSLHGLVKNLAMYLAVRPEDWPLPAKRTTTSKKKKKVRAIDKFNKGRRTWYVGKEVELPEHFIYKGTGTGTGAGAGRRLSKRVYVPGHFRRQACGKGWKDHKTIWIQPFYKGPDDAPVAEKRYHAKTLEEAGYTDA